MKLHEYVSSKPPGESARMAKHLGVSASFVSQMVSEKSRVPDRLLAKVIGFCNGAVRCEDLRPDVDWAFLRGSK